MVADRVGLDDFHRLELLETGFLGDLVFAFVGIVLEVPHVGDIAHIAHLVAQVLEQAVQPIVGDARTGVAQVGVAVDGRAADIQADTARMDRFEKFLLVRQGIEDIVGARHSGLMFKRYLAKLYIFGQ